MLHHNTESHDPYVASLLNLLQIVIEQNACLQQQIEDEKNHHHLCTHTLTEIRTPLTVIRTSANIIQRYNEQLTSDKRDVHLGNIDKQVAVITDLINQLTKTNSHHCHANKS
ncbi:MAG: hypothetical protein KJ043_03720 [Anaerolineae bacterium]|nr:hypothetical protein [Anaerolineae bacterium]